MRIIRPVLVIILSTSSGHGPVAQGIPRLRQVAAIGCSACGTPAQFATINDVVLTDSGSVLVVSSEAPTLRLFDLTGHVVWTAGRDGTGPGEYRLPIRASVGPDGIQVVDMALRRVSRLNARGAVVGSMQLGAFPASVAARGGSSDLVVLTDNFRGSRALERWSFADSAKPITQLGATETARTGTFSLASAAVSPSGEVAVLMDGNEYRIQRFSAAGVPLGAITRDLARVKRTPEEIAALERRRQAAASKAANERGRSGASPPLLRATGSDDLKPHIAVDGLRYDTSGRLWVRTMRGGESTTILDVFAPGGRFIGEITVPAAIGAFSLAGRWMAADTEAPDGTRIVSVWEVR